MITVAFHELIYYSARALIIRVYFIQRHQCNLYSPEIFCTNSIKLFYRVPTRHWNSGDNNTTQIERFKSVKNLSMIPM